MSEISKKIIVPLSLIRSEFGLGGIAHFPKEDRITLIVVAEKEPYENKGSNAVVYARLTSKRLHIQVQILFEPNLSRNILQP